MEMFSIKNEKLDFFNRPIYCENENEALTYIQNVLMSDADRALRGLREDLALYYLGSFDTKFGFINTEYAPCKIADLVDIFDTIPEEKIPRDSQALHAEIDSLKKAVLELQVEKVDLQGAYLDLKEKFEASLDQKSSKKGKR